MGNIGVAPINHRFLARKSIKYSRMWVPGIVPVWEAGKIALGVGHIGVDQVEPVVLTSDHPALAGVGRIGQIELKESGSTLENILVTGVPLFLSQMKGGKGIAKIFLRDDIGV